MKYIIKRIIKVFLGIIYFIYPYKLYLSIRNKFNLIYSYWLEYEINKGTTLIFHYPIKLVGGKYITIGENTSLGKNSILTAWDKHLNQTFHPKINIGKNCSFGEYNHITAINNIQIGSNVLTGRWVTITDNSHGKTDYSSLQKAPLHRNLFSKGPVIIEDNVWIGDKATILPNVHIGKGSIIAANAVVTKDIPNYSIAAGNPAKIIKTIN